MSNITQAPDDLGTKRVVENGEKRDITVVKQKGLGVRDLMLAAILLAVGQVLKSTIGTAIAAATGGAIKPNFIIAMYCLAILLIRPGFLEAAIIGLLAGAINQIMPATPLVNFGSELVGALVICVIVKISLSRKNDAIVTGEDELQQQKSSKALKILKSVGVTLVGTFVATLASGFTFVGLQYLLLGVKVGGKVVSLPDGYLAIFMGVIFGTAAINAVIVQVLYPALKRVLKK
ncbi:MAG: hypothetical protein LBT21_07695 [Oscillospiraceae bacterium]|jgi:hypothetical protein|nr:hypothetical protein [Oscillospiraceae bacterium]